MAEYFRSVEFNKDGTTKEPVQFVGVYVTRFPAGYTPTVAFVESDVDVEAMQTLLLKIGWVLEQPCWQQFGVLATLRNDIKDLIGE